MALVVEDGSVVTSANTYVSVATLDTYHEDRNNTDWAAASDEAKQSAVLDAARYLDFGYRWLGTRRSSTQPMAWPRYMQYLDADLRLVPSDEVPLRVQDAQCELALEALAGPLMASLDRGNREAKIQVGPLAVEYFPDAAGQKEFPVVDALLADLVAERSAGSLTATAVRA